jgi:hypothetical protein
VLKQLRAPYLPAIDDFSELIKASLLRGQPVNQAIQESEEDLPTSLLPEPAGWDKEF